jgi:hypothetical protein
MDVLQSYYSLKNQAIPYRDFVKMHTTSISTPLSKYELQVGIILNKSMPCKTFFNTGKSAGQNVYQPIVGDVDGNLLSNIKGVNFQIGRGREAGTCRNNVFGGSERQKKKVLKEKVYSDSYQGGANF